MFSLQRQLAVLLSFISLACGGILRNDTQNYEKDGMAGDGIGCPAKNSKFPVHLPHPTDCSKFYICDNGSPHLKECYPGLHFSPKIKTCDYPENAGCDPGDLRRPKDKTIEDDLGICPTKNSKFPVHLPHPADCSKFYICDNGSPHLKECQRGLHFNKEIKTCDYPENARCETGYKNKIDGKMVEDSDLCSDQNTSRPNFVPHPTDCTIFFVCQSGEKILSTCPAGLHFNSKKGMCDFPENAGCNNNFRDNLKRPKGKFLEENDLVFCPKESSSDQPILLSHPTDCDKFYICDHGKPVLTNCPSGLNFNEKLQACDYEENTICPERMTKAMAGVPSPYCPSRDGKIPIFYRHPTNCSIFYMCANGLAYEFVCPARLHFNVRRRICDYESNSGCRINS